MNEPRPLPRLPNRSARGPRPQRTATWIALFGLGIIASGLAGLVAVVLMPEFRVVVLAVGGLGFLIGGHYFFWGYWLRRHLTNKGHEAPVEFWRKAAPPDSPPPDFGEHSSQDEG